MFLSSCLMAQLLDTMRGVAPAASGMPICLVVQGVGIGRYMLIAFWNAGRASIRPM